MTDHPTCGPDADASQQADKAVQWARDQVIGLSSCVKESGEPCDLCEEQVDALIAAVRAEERERQKDHLDTVIQTAKHIRAATLADVERVVERMPYQGGPFCIVKPDVLAAIRALREGK